MSVLGSLILVVAIIVIVWLSQSVFRLARNLDRAEKQIESLWAAIEKLEK